MDATQADFRFPVLGFTRYGCWGFRDFERLTLCDSLALKSGSVVGMDLVDADLRCWTVRSVQRLGRAWSLKSWLMLPLAGPPPWRVAYELEALAPTTLDAAKNRICAWIEANPEGRVDYGEEATQVPPILAGIRARASVAEVYEEAGLAWWVEY